MSASEKQLDHARVWRKFLRLTRGRVSTIRAWDIIAEEACSEEWAEAARSIRDAMREGNPLSDAMDGCKMTFSASVRELVRTAEKTGAWDDIMAELVDGLVDGTFD